MKGEFPVKVMLAPIDNSSNWDVLVAIRDNTRQRQAQEALRTNEEKLRTLFEILPVGISFLGKDGIGLAALFFSNQGPALLGQTDRHLFASALVVYLFLIAANGIVMAVGLMSEEHQVQAMSVVDIAAFVTLMHASGGPASGLGLLNALTIAVGSLTMAGRQALLFAAIATLAVLGEQLYADLVLHARATAYTHAGLLGVAYFAIAVLAHQLSVRLHESERLRSRQEVDLANLQEVNDYVVRQLTTGVLVVDTEGRLRQANAAARILLGQPELTIGQPLSSALARLLRESDAPQRTVSGFRPASGGRSLRVRVNRLGQGRSAAALIFLDDESVLAAEAQRLKLASLGQLTASIAHEIRNPLGAIGHAVQLLDESPAFDEADRQLAGMATLLESRSSAKVPLERSAAACP